MTTVERIAAAVLATLLSACQWISGGADLSVLGDGGAATGGAGAAAGNGGAGGAGGAGGEGIPEACTPGATFGLSTFPSLGYQMARDVVGTEDGCHVVGEYLGAFDELELGGGDHPFSILLPERELWNSDLETDVAASVVRRAPDGFYVAGDADLDKRVFLARLDAAGNEAWRVEITSTARVQIHDVAVANDVWVAGRFTSGMTTATFPGGAPLGLDCPFGECGFVVGVAPDGSERAWFTLHNSTGQVFLDAVGAHDDEVVIGGSFVGADMRIDGSANGVVPGGTSVHHEAFVLHYWDGPNPVLAWDLITDGNGPVHVTAVAIGNGNVFAAGTKPAVDLNYNQGFIAHWDSSNFPTLRDVKVIDESSDYHLTIDQLRWVPGQLTVAGTFEGTFLNIDSVPGRTGFVLVEPNQRKEMVVLIEGGLAFNTATQRPPWRLGLDASEERVFLSASLDSNSVINGVAVPHENDQFVDPVVVSVSLGED